MVLMLVRLLDDEDRSTVVRSEDSVFYFLDMFDRSARTGEGQGASLVRAQTICNVVKLKTLIIFMHVKA